MDRRPGRMVLSATIGAAVVVGAGCLWLLATSPNRSDVDEAAWLTQLAANLFTIGVGIIAWRARPGNRVGPLLVAAGFASVVGFLSLSGDALAWTVGDMWTLLGFVVLAHVYLAFPDGRTRGWSRRLAIAVYAWFFAWTVGLRSIDAYPATWPFSNPFQLWPNAPLEAALSVVADLGALVLTVLVVGTVLDRWRRGSPVARRALAPVFWVSPITLAVVGTYFVGRITGSEMLLAISTSPLAQLSNFLLPAAFLIGLLQTRLQRTSIADLVRELDGVSTVGLEAALARATHDPTLRLAFPSSDGAGLVDLEGQPLPPCDERRRPARTWIQSGNGTLAVLLHDPAIEPALVESAAAASRLALENARLAAELRAQLAAVRSSRTRIVEAADEERRRLERDLHDGAQQRLVALGFTLRRASRQAEADAELAAVLRDAQRELEDGLRELRVLARGIHPMALADGLAPAITELADRSPIPVDVRIDRRPVPESVASTAYFIAAESLTNALRHADASRISISGTVANGHLRLQIEDDGRGGAGGADGGSGIGGLLDRAQAVGGSLTIESPPGGGTVIRADLPIR